MTIKALTHPTKPPLIVSTETPANTNSEERLKIARGIGTLRTDGYNVDPIKGHGTVYLISPPA